MHLDNEQFINDNKTHLTTLSHILSHTHSELLISLSLSLSLSSSSVCSTTFTGIIVKVATNCEPHTPLVVLQPWNFFKPMLLKTTITFIFIFSFVRLGGNIFLLPFYPRFSVWGERYRPSWHY